MPIASSCSHRTTVPIAVRLLGATACRFGPGTLGADGSVTPTVLSVMPGNGATGISGDGTVSVTFSEAMDPATLTSVTWTLLSRLPRRARLM